MSTQDKAEVENLVEEKPKRKQIQKQDENVTETPVNKLGIFKLHKDAQIPKFATEDSACFDLMACFEQSDKVKCVSNGVQTFRRVTDTGLAIHPGERFLIPTGLVFDIPKGYCMEIYPRSGISFKSGLNLSNCTAIIDSDYVEQTFISINNMGNDHLYIKSGDRIAQAKLVKLVPTEIIEIESKPEQKTSRDGGFGSTGK